MRTNKTPRRRYVRRDNKPNPAKIGIALDVLAVLVNVKAAYVHVDAAEQFRRAGDAYNQAGIETRLAASSLHNTSTDLRFGVIHDPEHTAAIANIYGKVRDAIPAAVNVALNGGAS